MNDSEVGCLDQTVVYCGIDGDGALWGLYVTTMTCLLE